MICWLLTLVTSLFVLGLLLPKFCCYDVIWDYSKPTSEGNPSKFLFSKSDVRFLINKKRLPVLLASFAIFLVAYFGSGLMVQIISERFTGSTVAVFSNFRNFGAFALFAFYYVSVSLFVIAARLVQDKEKVINIPAKENLHKKYIPTQANETFAQTKIIPKHIAEHYEISA
jgi:hypothetical protein